MQTNQAQVNEVLKHNVRAVSRVFSDREAPYGHVIAMGHDRIIRLIRLFIPQSLVCVSELKQVDAFVQLGGHGFTPTAE